MKECSPDIMSRFREEQYESRAYKAFIARGKVNPGRDLAGNARESRAKYFKNSPEARKAINKATQARLNGI